MALYIRGTQVAEPARGGVSLSIESLWDENTGRDVNSGKMIGDIIAYKKTMQITWPPLTLDQVALIIDAITADKTNPFFTVKYTYTKWTNGSGTAAEIKIDKAYSGNITSTIDSLSEAYQRHTGCTVTFIEQ